MNKYLFFAYLFSVSTMLQAELKVTDGWIRKPIGGVHNTAVFMKLTNTGDQPIRIISVRTSVAKLSQLHRIEQHQGTISMTPISELVVPVKGTVELSPLGDHIMLMKLTRLLKAGDPVKIELVLQNGHTQPFELTVQAFERIGD